MKVAIVCEELIERSTKTHLLNALLEMFPESVLYTFVHKPKRLKGIIERRKIHSTALSVKVDRAHVLHRHLYKLVPLAKKLVISCQYDLIINLSSGLAQGIERCSDCPEISIVMDDEYFIWNQKTKGLFNRLMKSYTAKYFISKFAHQKMIWALPSIHIPLPGLKIKPMQGVCKLSDYKMIPEKLISRTSMILREGEGPLLGATSKCAGELAPILAHAQALIAKDIHFPLILPALKMGTPVYIGNTNDLEMSHLPFWAKEVDGLHLCSELPKVFPELTWEERQKISKSADVFDLDRFVLEFQSQLRKEGQWQLNP